MWRFRALTGPGKRTPGDLRAGMKVCATFRGRERPPSHLLPLNLPNLEGTEALLWLVESYPVDQVLETQGMRVPTHLINPSPLGGKERKRVPEGYNYVINNV